eukprot:CAMPEP_0172505320 /NCGR_PEP_ID=MMETSP1066-20121228/185476_1 /TAXON_ID=671091 /ORGANISM="Coscinodiscus wailesii, Strain CCMP2513" /LENGTH=208 /DNA_ID=CAMNT_0013281885 /DNA_START=65 /DNA_END=687 /DNA_ORIENTATION=-
MIYSLCFDLFVLKLRVFNESVMISSKKSDGDDDRIRVISLLGERSSGTKWMFEELKKCFGGSLRVKRGLTRDKHWFQFDDGRERNKTMVIAMFRNPFDWTSAMIAKPHHAPNHFHLDWKKFVNKPWTMPRVGSDLNIPKTEGLICQEKFRYNEVVSCIKHPLPDEHYTWNTTYSERYPLYELKNDGSGQPYESIVDLRRDKILNFLAT